MKLETVRAFSDSRYDYYRLTKPFGMLPVGTIFVHDPDDNMYGSPAQGCLKNCWAPDGSCYGGLCGGLCSFIMTLSKQTGLKKSS